MENEINNVSGKINEENEDKVNNIKVLAEQMNQKFVEVHDAIDIQKQKREGIEGEYDNHINEVLEKMKEEFNKQKKNREEFEENVFTLIEETCTKLASYNA